MVNRLDQAAGMYERTSAEVGELPWTPSSEKRLGYLFAATLEGQNFAAFEVAPGQVILSIGAENLVSARRISGAINIVVEVKLRSNDGTGEIFSVGIRGPRGRVAKIFAFLGHPV